MLKKIKNIVYIFLLLLGIYTLLRLIFFGLYFDSHASQQGWIRLFYWGVRMDFSSLFYLNLLFFLWYLFGDYFLPGKVYRVGSFFLLFVLNIPMLALNIIDLAYYEFNARRSTIDIVYVGADSLHALPSFLKRYWLLLLLFMFFVACFVFFLRRFPLYEAPGGKERKGKNFLLALLLLLLLGALARGVGTRPVMPSTALLHFNPEYQPLVNNSTFTFLYSLFRKQTTLSDKRYFSDQKLDELFSIKREYAHKGAFQKRNVVIFILESFAKELLVAGTALKAKTPFLDSIMENSIVCENAYANGTESNKGIVALLGSLPPFLDEPYFYSSYSNNRLRGIGTILKDQGYTTHFFMGASPDHFGFGKFSRMVGIDNYYSEQQYGHPERHDGNWGIYDHYFLPYAADVLRSTATPFFATIFNISSHPPFAVPPSMKRLLAVPGQTEQQNSITYVDYSIKLFFEKIRKERWYDSTLFVFVADHSILAPGRGKAGLYSYFEIPMFFHIPAAKEHTIISKPVEQMDMVPTVLDMLHYGQPFMSFGKSVLESTPGFAVNKIFDTYQWIDSTYLLAYNPSLDSVLYLYDLQKDPLLTKDIAADRQFLSESLRRKERLQAIIQRFNQSLKKNQLIIK